MTEIDDPGGMRLSICLTFFFFIYLRHPACTLISQCDWEHGERSSLARTLTWGSAEYKVCHTGIGKEGEGGKNAHFQRLLITRHPVISTHLPHCAALARDSPGSRELLPLSQSPHKG